MARNPLKGDVKRFRIIIEMADGAADEIVLDDLKDAVFERDAPPPDLEGGGYGETSDGEQIVMATRRESFTLRTTRVEFLPLSEAERRGWMRGHGAVL